MSDMTLLPTGSLGGEAGAAGLGGAVGGLIGSWFGNGFGGRGFGTGYGYGDVAAVAVGANSVLDGINNLQTSVNNIVLHTIQGQNGTNLTIERVI